MRTITPPFGRLMRNLRKRTQTAKTISFVKTKRNRTHETRTHLKPTSRPNSQVSDGLLGFHQLTPIACAMCEVACVRLRRLWAANRTYGAGSTAPSPPCRATTNGKTKPASRARRHPNRISLATKRLTSDGNAEARAGLKAFWKSSASKSAPCRPMSKPIWPCSRPRPQPAQITGLNKAKAV